MTCGTCRCGSERLRLRRHAGRAGARPLGRPWPEPATAPWMDPQAQTCTIYWGLEGMPRVAGPCGLASPQVASLPYFGVLWVLPRNPNLACSFTRPHTQSPQIPKQPAHAAQSRGHRRPSDARSPTVCADVGITLQNTAKTMHEKWGCVCRGDNGPTPCTAKRPCMRPQSGLCPAIEVFSTALRSLITYTGPLLAHFVRTFLQASPHRYPAPNRSQRRNAQNARTKSPPRHH